MPLMGGDMVIGFLMQKILFMRQSAIFIGVIVP